jgi:hypothetical protein
MRSRCIFRHFVAAVIATAVAGPSFFQQYGVAAAAEPGADGEPRVVTVIRTKPIAFGSKEEGASQPQIPNDPEQQSRRRQRSTQLAEDASAATQQQKRGRERYGTRAATSGLLREGGSRRLPGSDYFDFDVSSGQLGSMEAGFIAGMAFLLALMCLCLLCCCCGGGGGGGSCLWDMVALACLWEICCDRDGAGIGDFQLV